jgi:phospholipase/carboxylesterase
VFPHAPQRPVTINGGMVMRAWYDVASPDLTQREDESGIRHSAEHIGRFIAAELAQGIASSRIVLAGFSQGGAIALFAGLRYAEPLAGILALSTYLPAPSRLSGEASAANRTTPILMAHGLVDPIIPVFQGENSARLLQQQSYTVEWKTYPMPHAVCAAEFGDIGQWLRQRLP